MMAHPTFRSISLSATAFVLTFTASANVRLPPTQTYSPSESRSPSQAPLSGPVVLTSGYDGTRYQGTAISIYSPGKQSTPEKDLTLADMQQLMGSSAQSDAYSSSQEEVVGLLQTYWLPNSMAQITGTFQALQGVKRNVSITFRQDLSSTFGMASWARCSYYGYGNSGADNRMVEIFITMDPRYCIATPATGSTQQDYKFDQILAHEMMHAFVAEIAPGFLLGPTNCDWFSEGSSEMVNGGVAHMSGRTSSQMCSRLGLSGGGDYGGSYLATCYASWLSANNGYGGTCSVTADNLAYGLDRILAKLRESGDLNLAFQSTIGMSVSSFESMVRSDSDGELAIFHNQLLSSCTNSEGTVGSGSVIGGNLKLQQDYVISNHPSSLNTSDPLQFTIG